LPLLFLAVNIQPLLAQDMPAAAGQPATTEASDCGLTISGKVLDHDTREPLIGATIYIPQLDKATVADANGNYHFHALCQGSYTLKVTYIGYEVLTTNVRVTSSAVRDLPLHPDTKTLSTVEVTGTHIQTEAQPTQTLQGRQLEETRGLSLGESLKQLSGVSSLQTGPNVSKPVIHGLYGNRILIINNGVRHEAQQWGDEHAPEIDPLIADQMQVVKGAAGVRYGSDAIGGTVLVNPKPLPDSAGTRGQVGLIGSTNNRMGSVSARVEGRLKSLPLSWRLYSSLKKAGSARTPDYYLKNTGFEEQNLMGALAYNKEKYGASVYYSKFHSKIGILSSAHIGNTTDLMNAIGRDVPEETGGFSYDINRPYQEVTHDLLKAKGYYMTGDLGKLEFTYAYQQDARDEYDKDPPKNDSLAALNRPELALNLQTHTTELVWEHKPIANLTGSIGASTLWQDNTYDVGSRYFIPFFRNFTAGVFAEEKWRIDNLQLEAGFRYDHKNMNIVKRERQSNLLLKPQYTFQNFSGSFGGLYDLGYHFTVSGNASYASRAPGASELFSDGVHDGTASYEVGDPNLKSENNISTVANLNYHSSPRVTGEASVYLNNISNYIYLQPISPPILTVRGAFPAYYYKQADARFWGIDLKAQVNLTEKLAFDTKGSIVRATNTEDGSYFPNIPADRIDNELTYEFGNVGQGFTGTYVSAGVLSIATQNRSSEQTDPYLAPPTGYSLLHANLGTTLTLGKQKFNVSITGNNLLNTQYRDYQNRLRYFADETGRMLIFRVNVPLAF